MAKIELKLDNWIYNAGLVGLYNILKDTNEESLEIKRNIISFDEKALNNFSQKYFNYLIKRYKPLLSWYKIVSYQENLKKLKKDLENDIETLKVGNFEEFNEYIKKVKKYLKSDSYKSAYELIETFKNVNKLDLLVSEKELATIRVKKVEDISKNKENALITIDKLLEIIDYLKIKEIKEQIAGKNTVYTIVKEFWDGISFLNPQTKEKNIYENFQKYFIDTLVEYLETDKSSYKYECFICENEIKNLDNNLSYLNNIGYDVSRKASHSWNFQNHIGICPICKLVYSCIPAGFNYTLGSGIFINYNRNIEGLIDINQKMYMDIYKPHEKHSSLPYKALYEAIYSENINSIKYEISDIQIIRYENEKYYFSILSPKVRQILKNSKEQFDSLIGTNYSTGNLRTWIYEEALNKVINNEKLNSLIYKLIWYKITNQSGSYYGLGIIFNLLKVNTRLYENNMEMLKNKENRMEEDKKIYVFRKIGNDLRNEYISRSDEATAKSKINTISYKLMNGINTGDVNVVMSTIINSYMYTKVKIPFIINELLIDEYKLKNYGYSFVIGLLGEKDNTNKGGNSND